MGSQLLQTQLQSKEKGGKERIIPSFSTRRWHLQLCGTRADFLKQFSAQKHRDVPARDSEEKGQRVCRADNRGKRCWAEIAELTLKGRKHSTDIFSGPKQQYWWYYALLTPWLQESHAENQAMSISYIHWCIERTVRTLTLVVNFFSSNHFVYNSLKEIILPCHPGWKTGWYVQLLVSNGVIQR